VREREIEIERRGRKRKRQKHTVRKRDGVSEKQGGRGGRVRKKASGNTVRNERTRNSREQLEGG